MRKLTLQVRDANGVFEETYVEGERGSFPVGHPDPEAWARTLVGRFNATLRAHESPRAIEAIEMGETARFVIEHDWRKSNLVTVISRGEAYDEMRCTLCGITGKRLGLGGGGVRIDSKWRIPPGSTCQKVQDILTRRHNRQS